MKKILGICLCGFLAAGALLFLKYSRSEFATAVKSLTGDYFNQFHFPARPDWTGGLDVLRKTYYVNGKKTPDEPKKPSESDVKGVAETKNFKRFCDYATGFMIDLPAAFEMDVSKSPKFVSFESPKAKLVVSREWAVDPDVDYYIDYYFFRFIVNERFQKENQYTVIQNEKRDKYQIVRLKIDDLPGKPDDYTYIIFKTQSRIFYRVFLKQRSENAAETDALIQQIINGFQYFRPAGQPEYTVDYAPVTPGFWSDETKSVYDRIVSSDKLMWGLYSEEIMGKGIREGVPQLEKRLDYKFDIILAYLPMNDPFPAAFMQACADQNRLVELTYQMTFTNNEDLYTNSPSLNLYRKGGDERIRDFARAAKKFGRPFLFRLNNEMNSDWTSYGGVINLMDPDIFVENWKTIYKIFEEEKVSNAIWIFNPNDRDCPPNGWNSFAAYYPGNAYVQMIGVTGYNNGSYYINVTGEHWRDFQTIYDSIVTEYDGMFDKFPWIITEFSSSSYGGSKAKWIDDMFAKIPQYPHIKAAVWFNAADYDPEKEGVACNPYWLDETEETFQAFKNGLHKIKS